MSDAGPGPPVGDPRVSTGCAPLDTMLHGGLVARRPYLVVGPSGTGKTTLALQFLCEGVRRGEKVLLVTLEEPPNEMRRNHRTLVEELDRVQVFDAIPDVMRYERAPFKDISAVRQSVPFSQVPMAIRKTAELSSVEVTFTALEQMLKMEMARQGYQRLVIDSLTALQYFCMKGFDETLGAQTFLRFLSDLRVTTLLTVEAPLEDVETPERLLARGEVRLFRWEREGLTVRAVGVEKFRGSEHDVRLHPYRITPRGIDINLSVTISRDTQEEIHAGPAEVEPAPAPPTEAYATDLGSLEQDCRDLVGLGADLAGLRATVQEALAASEHSSAEEIGRIVARARGRVFDAVSRLAVGAEGEAVPEAVRRLRTRATAARAGIPPHAAPALEASVASLRRLLTTIDDGPVTVVATPASTAPAAPRPVAPTVLAPPAASGPATAPEGVSPETAPEVAAAPGPTPSPPAAEPPTPVAVPRESVPETPAVPELPRSGPGHEPPGAGPAREPAPPTAPVRAGSTLEEPARRGETPEAEPRVAVSRSPPAVRAPRPEPPPLPNVAVPLPPPTAPPTSGAAAPTGPGPAGAASGPAATPDAEAAGPSPSGAAETAPKRRRRAAATGAPRKRTPRKPAAAALEVADASPAPLDSGAAAAAPTPSGTSEALSAPPKRRAARKKAPSPTGGGTATPTPPPAGAAPGGASPGSDAPSAAPGSAGHEAPPAGTDATSTAREEG